MNILEDKFNTFNQFFQIILVLLRSDLKISSKTSSALSLIIMSMLSIFEWITRSSSLSLEEIKLIGIVNCIFHVSDNLKLFMISSSKYGLISLRYSVTINNYSKKYQFLLVYNDFFCASCSKRFPISLITLFWIFSFSFFSLKRFLITLFLVALFSSGA